MTGQSHLHPNPIPDDLHDSDLCVQEGNAFYFQSRYAEAHKAYQRALEQVNSSCKDDTLELSPLYHKLGLSSLKLANISDAHSFFAKAHELLKSKGENNSPLDLAKVLHAIGETYTLEAKYSEAEEYLMNAVKIIQKNYGEEHNELRVVYNKLSILYYGQRRTVETLEFLERAVKISLLQNNENDPELATSYYYLAMVYAFLDDYDKVKDYIQKSLQLTKYIYGENHVEVALRMSIIAEIENNEERYSEALEYYQKGFKMLSDFLDDNHLELADFYGNIADMNSELKKHDEALMNYQKALEIEKRFLPENHPYIGYSYGGIAWIYKKKRLNLAALDFYNKAINLFTEKFGETYSEICCYLENMADIYEELGQCSQSVRLMEQSLQIELKKSGPKDPRVADIYNDLGYFYHEDKKYAEAIKSYLTSYRINHSLTQNRFSKEATCMSNLSRALRTNGNLDAGESAFKKRLICLQKDNEEKDGNIREVIRGLRNLQKKRYLQDINQNCIF